MRLPGFARAEEIGSGERWDPSAQIERRETPGGDLRRVQKSDGRRR